MSLSLIYISISLFYVSLSIYLHVSLSRSIFNVSLSISFLPSADCGGGVWGGGNPVDGEAVLLLILVCCRRLRRVHFHLRPQERRGAEWQSVKEAHLQLALQGQIQLSSLSLYLSV